MTASELVVVGQSFGAFTAPLVAERLPVEVLVLVAGMIPAPGEPPGDWWANTGYSAAVREQAARDGGLTGNDDPYVSFYHDVPRKLAEEALSKERAHPSEAVDGRAVAARRVAGRADEIRAVHRGPLLPGGLLSPAGAPSAWTSSPTRSRAATAAALSRPKELADMLEGYAAGATSASRLGVDRSPLRRGSPWCSTVRRLLWATAGIEPGRLPACLREEP